MDIHDIPSKLLRNAVEELSKLPGIGKKTALRMALFLLKQPLENVNYLGNTIIKLRNEIMYCKSCNNISDTELCEICSNNKRNHSIICVVENIRDVISIENTHQYNGIYHVLGGIISPIDGIGPSSLKIDNLLNKLENHNVEEVILALSTTMEGDTTNFYLYKKLSQYKVKISAIARGISFGDELEYADEITLGKAITNRMPFESTITN
jgi:recombination protein RecR